MNYQHNDNRPIHLRIGKRELTNFDNMTQYYTRRLNRKLTQNQMKPITSRLDEGDKFLEAIVVEDDVFEGAPEDQRYVQGQIANELVILN